MRYAMRLLRLSIVLSMAVALTGCMMSVAFESDLVPGTTPAPAVGTARFYIADVQVSTSGKSDLPQGVTKPQGGTKLFGTPGDLSSEAVSARPNLFSDDLSAVPLLLKLDCEYRNSMSGAVLAGLTVGIIPAQGSEEADYTVSITVLMPEGDESLGSVAFKRRDVTMVALTPLGLNPGPGTSVIPLERQAIANASADYLERAQKLTNAVCIEAVVKALGQCDAAKLAKLQALCEDRKSRIQSLSLDGKPCWGYVSFSYSKPGAASSTPRDVANLLIFTTAPTRKTVPSDRVTVARRGEDGRWRPCSGYLRRSRTLTAASVLLENGKPGRVVLRPVEEPEIDDFLDLPAVAEKDRAQSIRWSNGVLLQVKNRSMPRLVRERSGTELLDLMTRIEKVVLMLDQQATQCNDRAQQMIERGTGDPAPEREKAVLYRQRIDVLRPILATIKQEAARKKP